MCGDRNWSDRAYLYDCLDDLRDNCDTPLVIIHGCARGADTMAGDWAKANGLMVLEYPALWSQHGRAAGPIRNRQMLDEGKPELVLAFHENIRESKGTRDMVRQASKAGVQFRVNAKGREWDQRDVV